MSIVRIFAVSALLGMTLLAGGCASYYTHYGAFPASNSAGEGRQFRVTWQTAEYPDWWFSEDQATPITLEGQCSTREWTLDDGGSEDSDESGPDCGSGIVACGDPDKDIVTATGKRATAADRCMAVTGVADIVGLGREMNLSVYCRPAQSNVMVDGESENRDYLRASVVPYEIRVRKVQRHSLEARLPDLDEHICDAE